VARDEGAHLVIAGAAGTIGTILLSGLAGAYSLSAFDTAVDPGSASEIAHGDVRDREFLQRAFRDATVVVHLATGMHGGWEGLLSVDVVGTKQLLDAACATGIRRVVLASSNHISGGFELDRLRSPVGGDGVLEVTEPIRPDSEYGAAKAFAEAYGRFLAETTDLAVSCLRIGTVAPVDDPAAHRSAQQFDYIPGGPEAVERRLRATWLYHDDLLRIVREEIEATDRFRLRFAVSDNPGRFWSLDVYRWNP
jgi:nucleoside-diphosphate-sugar epimerase